MGALSTVIQQSKALLVNNKPVMVIMKTEMGAGVDFMMHSHKWHGVAPNDEQLALALGQLEETLGDY
jgi:transketolase